MDLRILGGLSTCGWSMGDFSALRSSGSTLLFFSLSYRSFLKLHLCRLIGLDGVLIYSLLGFVFGVFSLVFEGFHSFRFLRDGVSVAASVACDGFHFLAFFLGVFHRFFSTILYRF